MIDVSPDRDKYVHLPENFLSVAQKLRDRNSSICFWSYKQEFKILVRNVPVASSSNSEEPARDIELEYIIIHEDDDSDSDDDLDTLGRVLELNYDGCFDDDCSEYFVMDTVEIPRTSQVATHPDVLDAMQRLNDLYATRICECCNAFVRKGDAMCLACELGCTPEKLNKETCPICHDEGPVMHMETQKCCNQKVHRSCLHTWKATKKRNNQQATCPLCRSSM